jgi:hypothetical protein
MMLFVRSVHHSWGSPEVTEKRIRLPPLSPLPPVQNLFLSSY